MRDRVYACHAFCNAEAKSFARDSSQEKGNGVSVSANLNRMVLCRLEVAGERELRFCSGTACGAVTPGFNYKSGDAAVGLCT